MFSNFTSGVAAVVVAGYEFVWVEHRVSFLTSIVIVSTVIVHRYSKKRKLRQKWNSAGENVVVVHGFPRTKILPNFSAYVLKLETYLRMAGIKYMLDTDQPFGSKGKAPWITLNGEDYTDSQLIIEFLGKKFNKNFSSDLTAEQKAVARSMLIMNDEHIIYGYIWWRFVKDPEGKVFELMESPLLLRMFIGRLVRNVMWTQGIGRHADDVKESMIRKDIEALSLYLGNKPFLMGQNPCEVDCAIFGMISQFAWGMPGSPFESIMNNDFHNLVQYCTRMKERFWPDWDETLRGSK